MKLQFALALLSGIISSVGAFASPKDVIGPHSQIKFVQLHNRIQFLKCDENKHCSILGGKKSFAISDLRSQRFQEEIQAGAASALDAVAVALVIYVAGAEVVALQSGNTLWATLSGSATVRVLDEVSWSQMFRTWSKTELIVQNISWGTMTAGAVAPAMGYGASLIPTVKEWIEPVNGYEQYQQSKVLSEDLLNGKNLTLNEEDFNAFASRIDVILHKI